MRSAVVALLALAHVASAAQKSLMAHNRVHAPEEVKAQKPKRAYVTLLTKEDKDPSYVKAAAVLVTGLRARGTTADTPIIVAVTSNISETTRCRLRSLGAEVREIEEVKDPCPSPLPVCDHKKSDWDRRWVGQFTKFNLWKWTEFDQIAFYDVDHLVLSKLDGVFDSCKQEFCTAKGKSLIKPFDDSHGGFFVFRPSLDTHAKLMEAFDQTQANGWKYDGENIWNEQPLLVKFFYRKMGNQLPFTIDYSYHGSDYGGMPLYPQMKAIHSKFWVEMLRPGRNQWYKEADQAVALMDKADCPAKQV
jgi:alpha-N-acetylglucosamine transferase